MRIRLLAFASAGPLLEAIGPEIDLPEGATVAELTAALARLAPLAADQIGRWAVAVDGDLAAAGRPLADGVEVALLPPVSGG